MTDFREMASKSIGVYQVKAIQLQNKLSEPQTRWIFQTIGMIEEYLNMNNHKKAFYYINFMEKIFIDLEFGTGQMINNFA